MRVLVTGAKGSIGRLLVQRLKQEWHQVYATDIDTLDVRDADAVQNEIARIRPAIIFHLAAEKHAPEGETDPEAFALTNVMGTANVLAAAGEKSARVVLASTCKACDPETVYGASKLIAERMVLNAGGSVARFFNVPESSGNVFRLWEAIPEDEAIPVTPCMRYFITLDQAVGLLMAAIDLPAGRYCVDPGPSRWMHSVAVELYPDRLLRDIPLRRGDRRAELLCAKHEHMIPEAGEIWRVASAYDPQPALEQVAA